MRILKFIVCFSNFQTVNLSDVARDLSQGEELS